MNRKDIIHLVLALFFIAMSINLTRTTISIFKNTNRLRELEVEVAELEKEKAEIQGSIDYKKTDEYVESFARNELNMVKSGEDVFVVVRNDVAEKDGSTKDLSNVNKETDSNLSLWINLFFE